MASFDWVRFTPQGGRISGTSSIVQFDACELGRRMHKSRTMHPYDWPIAFRTRAWWAGEERGFNLMTNSERTERDISVFLKNATLIQSIDCKRENLAFKAMARLV